MAEIFSNNAETLSRPVDGTFVARSATQEWQPSGTPGFLVKALYEDAESGERTWLMKVEAGASAPPHAHDDYEQIFVLEGTFDDGENVYGPGDYAVRAPGVDHSSASADGALMLLIYSR